MGLRFRRTLLLTIFILTLSSHTGARSEQAITEDRADVSPLIEEVVVYATKKNVRQSAQEVPGAINAFNNIQLASKSMVNLQDLSFSMPNTALDDIGSVPGIQNFAIRGLGINSSIPSIDPAVGVFVDGIYLGISYATNVDTFNLESVEVLRGPQGVLFGRNVTGGAILVRTRRPDGESRVLAKAGIESGPKWTTAASVEGSILDDELFGMLAVYHKDSQGNIPNVTVNRDVGQMESTVLRPTIVYRPSNELQVDVIFEFGKNEGDGFVPQQPLSLDPLNISDNITTHHNNIGFNDQRWLQLVVEGVYDITANSRITNIFGWRDLSSDAGGDADSSPLDLFDLGIFLDQDQVSNELRYNRLGKRWDTTVGVYYFTQSLNHRETRSLLAELRGGNPIEVAGGGKQDHTTWGVYASSDFKVSDTVTMTAGLRRTKEKKDADVFMLGSCDFVEASCDGALPFLADDHTWTNWTPKLGFSWKPSDNAMLYGHWTKGYRSGGYNLRVTSPAVDPGPTDAEKVTAYEIGAKTQAKDGRFRFNIAAFFNELESLQREVNTSDPSFGIVQGIVNTADGEILGVEIDSAFALTNNIRFDLSFGYMDFKYTNIKFDLTGDGLIDEKDKKLALPRLADWNYNIGVNLFDLYFGDNKYINARLDYGSRDEAPYTDNNLGMLPRVDMLSARFDVIFDNVRNRIRASIYGQNLLDEVALGSNAPLPFAAIGAPRNSALAEGRRYGLEIEVNWDL